MFLAKVTQGDAQFQLILQKRVLSALFSAVFFCIFVLLLSFKHSAKVLAPKHRALLSLMKKTTC